MPCFLAEVDFSPSLPASTVRLPASMRTLSLPRRPLLAAQTVSTPPWMVRSSLQVMPLLMWPKTLRAPPPSISRSSSEKMAAPLASSERGIPSLPEVTEFSLPSASTSFTLSACCTRMAAPSALERWALARIKVTFSAASPVSTRIRPLSSVPLTRYSPPLVTVATEPETLTPSPLHSTWSPSSVMVRPSLSGAAVAGAAAGTLSLPPQPVRARARSRTSSRGR